MLDFIKVIIKNVHVEQRLWLEENFNFGGYFEIKNGNEIPVPSRSMNPDKMIWRKVFYRGMEMRLGWRINGLSGKEFWHLVVEGSIHKYARDGKNSDRFNAADAISAVNDLCIELRINKKKAEITQMELGVNLIGFDFDLNEWVTLDLLRYKNFPFCWMKTIGKKKPIGKEAILSHRTVKVYVKEKTTLRIEIHWNDMQELKNGYKLKTLNDLTEKLIFNVVNERLVKTFDNIYSLNGIRLVGNYMPTGLSKCNQKVLMTFTNERYLIHLDYLIKQAWVLDNVVEYKKLTLHRKRGFAKLMMLVSTYGRINAHAAIRNKIDEFLNQEYTPKIHPFLKRDTNLQIAFKNNKMNTTDFKKKSNKQLSIEKREQKKLIYNSFFDKLKVTLIECEKMKAPVQHKAAA